MTMEPTTRMSLHFAVACAQPASLFFWWSGAEESQRVLRPQPHQPFQPQESLENWCPAGLCGYLGDQQCACWRVRAVRFGSPSTTDLLCSMSRLRMDLSSSWNCSTMKHTTGNPGRQHYCFFLLSDSPAFSRTFLLAFLRVVSSSNVPFLKGTLKRGKEPFYRGR